METKLWNRGSGGFTSEFSLGGLPVFTDDLQMMQNISTELYGVASLLKGYSCVLRGCLVDTLDINAKTVSITEGVILIDDTIYHVDAFTTPYPFSFIKAGEVVDTRLFKDASSNDVATTFSFGIKTSFTYGTAGSSLQSIMPTNITETEIHFDPFTAQRQEYILKGHNLAEVISLKGESNVTFTETGKGVIGGSISYLTADNEGRWKYLGWNSLRASPRGYVLRNSALDSPSPNVIGGENDLKIGYNNLPGHTHTFTTTTEEDGSHNHKFNKSGDGNVGDSVENGTAYFLENRDLDIASTDAGMKVDGVHTHAVVGRTDFNATANIAIDTRSRSLYVNMMEYKGLTQYESFYKFKTGFLPFTNM